jgi:hypothetical protein
MLQKEKEWLRRLALRACHDMVQTGQQDHFIVLWTSTRGLPRMYTLRAFRDTILLRENMELRWLLGGVDYMVSLHEESHDFFMAIAVYGAASRIACLQHLRPWSPIVDVGLPSLSNIALPTQLLTTQDLEMDPEFGKVVGEDDDEGEPHLEDLAEEVVL